jgi:hypothetical protein
MNAGIQIKETLFSFAISVLPERTTKKKTGDTTIKRSYCNCAFIYVKIQITDIQTVKTFWSCQA